MWVRWVEIACALWLAGGTVVLGSGSASSGPALAAMATAALVVVLAAASHVVALRRAHLGVLPVALAIAMGGWWSTWTSGGASAIGQSWMVTGLVLAMTSLVPSHAAAPPDAWRRPDWTEPEPRP